MPWRRPSSRASREDGFTFVEVLLGLLILSLLGTMVAGALSAALRGSGRIAERLAETSGLARLDDELRALCARVRPPYWESTQPMSRTASGVRVGWMDGSATRELSIECREGALWIGDGDRRARYAGFCEASVEPVEDEAGRLVALRLTVRLSGGRELALVARLGSAVVDGEGGP